MYSFLPIRVLNCSDVLCPFHWLTGNTSSCTAARWVGDILSRLTDLWANHSHCDLSFVSAEGKVCNTTKKLKCGVARM